MVLLAVILVSYLMSLHFLSISRQLSHSWPRAPGPALYGWMVEHYSQQQGERAWRTIFPNTSPSRRWP
jgi:hypothetical protein